MEPEPGRQVGFRAPLYRIGRTSCVNVPRRVSALLGARWRLGVTGVIGARSFRSTLVPRGGGNHRLFISGGILRALGVSPGDLIFVRLRATDSTPDVTAPGGVPRPLEPAGSAPTSSAGPPVGAAPPEG